VFNPKISIRVNFMSFTSRDIIVKGEIIANGIIYPMDKRYVTNSFRWFMELVFECVACISLDAWVCAFYD